MKKTEQNKKKRVKKKNNQTFSDTDYKANFRNLKVYRA